MWSSETWARKILPLILRSSVDVYVHYLWRLLDQYLGGLLKYNHQVTMAKKSAKKAAKQKRQQQQRQKQKAQERKASETSQVEGSDEEIVAKLEMIAVEEPVKIMTRQAANLGPVSLSLRPSGLPNMGSTCYFNSVLQVLGQTYVLNHLLMERSQPDYTWNAKTYFLDVKEGGKGGFKADSRQVMLPEVHPLISTFLKLQQEIFGQKTANPRALLGEIRKECSQFEGWFQQDSQELLISLLASMKKVESERQMRVLSKALGINTKSPSNEDKLKAQRFRITAKHTVLDAIFGGQLLTYIRCTACNYRSFAFEHFMDLSLSLNVNKKEDLVLNLKKWNNSQTVTKSTATVGKGKKAKKQAKAAAAAAAENDEEKDDDDDLNVELFPLTEDEPEEGRNLTAKERKQKRAEKKAAKREARQALREKANKEQDKSMLEHFDGADEGEDDDDEEDGGKDAADGDVSDLKMEDDDFKEPHAIHAMKPEEWTKDWIPAPEGDFGDWAKETEDWTKEPVIEPTDFKNLEVDLISAELLQFPIDLFEFKPDVFEPKPEPKAEPSVEEVFFGTIPPQSLKIDEIDSGCEHDEEDLDPEPLTPVFYGPALPDDYIESMECSSSDKETKAGDSDSGQEWTGSTSTPTGSGGSSSDDGDANCCSGILPHIDPQYREKFYDIAMQKVAYTDFANGDLGALFEAFIKPETLDGTNKYLCECCSKANDNKKTYTKAIRAQLIALPPPVLVVHLKRFQASGYGGRRGMATMQKLNTPITFPERLNLSPYTSKLYESLATFYEPQYDAEAEETKLEYQLYGAVIHSGGLRSGHYMAYVAVRPEQYADRDRLERFVHLKPFVSNIEHIISVCYDQEMNKAEEEATEEKMETQEVTSLEGEEAAKTKSSNDSRKWFFISDSSVSNSSLQNVLNETTSPYLLFYERIN